ncbi:MAG TPA: hypothetical protein VJR29_00175 [bacterium]|nr:hypothetical protein [bacterium]
MTPPRALPPGHFVGDGHNHGGGHDHVHESSEEHLHHLQQRQEVRGRASLEEFQRAARETAQLTSGQRPETPPPRPRGEPRAPSREPATRGSISDPRQAPSPSENPGPKPEPARGTVREFAGQTRLFATAFAALPRQASAFAEAGRQSLPRAANSAETANSPRNAAPPPSPERLVKSAETNESGALMSFEGSAEPPVLSEALTKLQVALRQAGERGSVARQIPAEAAEALVVLLQEAMAAPELLSQWPPGLKAWVQSQMGPAGALLPALLAKLHPAAVGEALQVLLGARAPAGPGLRLDGSHWALRSLGLSLGAPLFSPAVGSRHFSPGLLQRFERALLQFLRLFGGHSKEARPAKESPTLDKALLEQLAALIAAEEKRRKERERAKRKEEVPAVLRAKSDADFNEDYEGARESQLEFPSPL